MQCRQCVLGYENLLSRQRAREILTQTLHELDNLLIILLTNEVASREAESDGH